MPLVGLGFDAAVQYSERGAKVEDGSSKTLRSFEVPINFRYSVGLASVASVYFATGPQFGFNIGNKNWNITDTSNYQLKKSTVSWNFGVGTRLVNHLELGVGYNLILGKMAKVAGNNGDYSYRANSWQIQVAYIF